jgi:hypothetical protein
LEWLRLVREVVWLPYYWGGYGPRYHYGYGGFYGPRYFYWGKFGWRKPYRYY